MSEENEATGEVATTERPKWQYGQVSAKDHNDADAELDLDFGNNLAEMVEEFGENLVHYAASCHLTRSYRNKLYSLCETKEKDGEEIKGMTAEAALAEMENFEPKVPAKGSGSRKSASQKAMTQFDKMSPDVQKDFLEKLLAKAAEAGE